MRNDCVGSTPTRPAMCEIQMCSHPCLASITVSEAKREQIRARLRTLALDLMAHGAVGWPLVPSDIVEELAAEGKVEFVYREVVVGKGVKMVRFPILKKGV